ncbi:hypothetical protein [Paenibacillus peoriae]|uniref:hypothetical protein n=1 Tax=Paenibacillus peoriae TaxID=59893 RepID=UPI00096D7342|nr:hypothetical protein [Paenibacillus peoriae]OMF50865.1 hypothetical protein BK135_00970 [Paenibacillus peoriae]
MYKCDTCGETFQTPRLKHVFGKARTIGMFLTRNVLYGIEEVCPNCGSNSIDFFMVAIDIENIRREFLGEWYNSKPPDSPQ